jgi:glycosyltransferase involved in cell wall biosynthesis
MKKPRILHLGKFYPPTSGGIETALETLCHEESGTIENRALVMNKARHTVHEVLDGVTITRVGSIATVGAVSVAATLPMWLARASASADVVVLHEPNPMALVAYFLVRPALPLVVWYHSEVIRPSWRYRLFYKPFLEFALRSADCIVVGSPPMKEVAALVPHRAKCVVVPYGLDPRRYQATPAIAERAATLRQSLNGPVLLFVGRLVGYKGVEVLLRALPGLHAHTVIVGDGPLRDVLSHSARELGLADRVQFVGEVSDEELLAWYYAGDALVLPSTSRQEAFGLVQLEAMLCGRPVISTNLPTGVPWVNQHERTGLVVPPGDVAALRGALARLVCDVDLRRRLGETARSRALTEFAAEGMCRAARRVYQDVCPDVFPPRRSEAPVLSLH